MFKIVSGFMLLMQLCFCAVSEEKVLIFTYAYNRPDFIELQYKTFKKFVKDPYEFIVFNDASNPVMKGQIRKMCAQLNIRCLNIPQGIHEQPYLLREPGDNFNAPSARNCNVVQYSLNMMGFRHKGIVALFDSDLFLVKEFSFRDFLKDRPIAGLYQSRSDGEKTIPYLWIGLGFFDFSKVPDYTSLNFNCGHIDGINVDAGGFTYYYLKEHPSVPIRYFNQYHIDTSTPCSMCNSMSCEQVPGSYDDKTLKEKGLDKNQIHLVRSGFFNAEFMENATFLHYRTGTNWDGKTADFHQRKTRLLAEYMESILSE